MTIACTRCKASYEIEHLVADNVFEAPTQDIQIISVLAESTYHGAGFTYLAPRGLEAASEGDGLIIIRCPECSETDCPGSGSRDDDDDLLV